MSLSYENYMNLLFHLDHGRDTVPPDIARRIVSNAISPVISVSSTPELDKHIRSTYHLDSLYMFLRFFGDCVSDRDQANEFLPLSSKEDPEQANILFGKEDNETEGGGENSLKVPSASNDAKSTSVRTNGNAGGARKRSNSLFQRDQTQSQYVRFTRPLDNLIESSDSNDMLFDYHSLEVFLESTLRLTEKYTNANTPFELLKKSLYHKFFSLAISSTTYLSPYETFNHPVVSLIAIDISAGQSYEEARDLLMRFKNLNHTVENFPIFMSTVDILPVFLLCYDENSEDEQNACQQLANQLKKQLFVESLSLPLWKESYSNDVKVELHQPVMSSLEEILYFFKSPTPTRLPLQLVNITYNILEKLVKNLMVPFMKRKISFWEETILQPKKSLFHGAKFFKKLISKNSNNFNNNQPASLGKDKSGNEYFISSSTEFLMRKLADWSMMLSDFKTAYATYESLIQDLENFPKYLASCFEWCAVSVLMGAQNIVTVKMIKNDINPLIQRALETYENCAADENSTGEELYVPVRSYETRCMFLASELFLSLSDTWTSTPYALSSLETILTECRLGPCSQIMIWERLSDCYFQRIDPRIRHKNSAQRVKTTVDEPVPDEEAKEEIVTRGLTRKRKAAFFRLIAANKWVEQKQWKQAFWCLKEIEGAYTGLEFVNREDLILARLKRQMNEAKTHIDEFSNHKVKT
ncbi:trafficking protein particle complex III-specific subunit 85 [Zygosaccharomyces mellis]|uniref:Trafficking protein particle complex III-specific subunit 85 n=1 Tax=Zygosaccharomyces mellis TaxID=42258 RepID=A0A4C2ECF2_9SACH|nr:trafficking protein particle complex III-specific subunit 85 [Zygosaccharomyces mellis]